VVEASLRQLTAKMIENATAAAGAMSVIDWKRTGVRPIAFCWS
jgi:hypothetical protein